MEGGLYTLLGLLVGRLFTWLDNRTKSTADVALEAMRLQYDTKIATLTLQNETLKAQNAKQEDEIVALTTRVTQLENLLAAQLTARANTTG